MCAWDVPAPLRGGQCVWPTYSRCARARLRAGARVGFRGDLAVGVHLAVVHHQLIHAAIDLGECGQHIELARASLMREDGPSTDAHPQPTEELLALLCLRKTRPQRLLRLLELADRSTEHWRVVATRCSLVDIAHRLRLGVAHSPASSSSSTLSSAKWRTWILPARRLPL
eukprot:7192470-Prymnesium_polylepis.1